MPTKNSNFSISALRDITVKIPLNIDSDSVGYETLGENEIAEVINYNLKSILLTHPGELMDTSFGVGLRNFLFEQSVNPNLVGSLIESQISTYMPWLTDVEVETVANTVRNFF